LIACTGFVLLQTIILLTGNYGFFNYLTILLSLLLLDDKALSGMLPGARRKLTTEPARSDSPAVAVAAATLTPPAPSPSTVIWPWWVTATVGVFVLAVTLPPFLGMFGWDSVWLSPGTALARWAAPFRSFNTYGLFAVMTTNRPEIIIEGSDDRQTWHPYVFKYKPGPVTRVPRFVAPYQPRLDWQMWFAALGSYKENRWFVNLCGRLLEGSAPVLGLLEDNPFPLRPPRYLRTVVYEYHFTDWATRRRTGAWWGRESKGSYLPVISLHDLQPEAGSGQAGR
jgi:hypothetical protein